MSAELRDSLLKFANDLDAVIGSMVEQEKAAEQIKTAARDARRSVSNELGRVSDRHTESGNPLMDFLLS